MNELTGNLLEETCVLLTDGEVDVHKTIADDVIIYTIIVERSEYGKVCGAKGKMIRAIKYLWESCMSRRLNKPIRVILKEPNTGFSKGRQPSVPLENFDADEFHIFLSDVAEASCGCELEYKKFGEGEGVIYKYTILNLPSKYFDTSEFRSSFETLATAIAKANGGHILLNYQKSSNG